MPIAIGGIILLLVTWLLSFSGYLLPWDQLSLWAVTIGVSMVEAIPPEVVGRPVLTEPGPAEEHLHDADDAIRPASTTGTDPATIMAEKT